MRYVALIDGKPGAFGVAFPDMPGCAAMGKTVEDAMRNAADALRDWIVVAEENSGKVPVARSVDRVRQDHAVRDALREGARLASVRLVRI